MSESLFLVAMEVVGVWLRGQIVYIMTFVYTYIRRGGPLTARPFFNFYNVFSQVRGLGLVVICKIDSVDL